MSSVKNQDKRDMDGIIGNVNENKTKCNSFLLIRKSKNRQKVGDPDFRERERECLLSRFPAVRTVGSLRAEK